VPGTDETRSRYNLGDMTSPRALLAVMVLVGCVTACRGLSPPGGGSDNSSSQASSASGGADWFVDRAAEAGLDFVHFNGMSGALYYAEHMGPGAALFDYDNDGDLDVFLPQGQMLGSGKKLEQALFPPRGPRPVKGRLFRNDLQVHTDGTRALRFTDATVESGLDATVYGMGVATGDYNNDGCIDLYVTALGRNQLFRNNCNRTFANVSKESGADDTGWSASAAFVDYDRDGWLDLFVGHYVAYTPDRDTRCYSMAGTPGYCPPHVYAAEPSHLHRNNRDGTFSDVTGAAGLSREFGPALGVATADFNDDGWPDIYVANDGQPNQLWINAHDGTFRNTGLLSGTALSVEGEAKASMGVDAGDVDNDGDEDLFITELTGQGADLYVNDGSGLFTDQSVRSRLRFATLPFTGFGTAWFDYDNDGWLDILTVNGAVTAIEDQVKANEPFPLRQRKQLLRNVTGGGFEDVTARAGAIFQRASVGRGAAFGDLDNDGRTDVVVANNSGPAELLMNEFVNGNHWIGIRAVSAADVGRAEPNPRGHAVRDAVGARVGIVRADGSTLWRRARAEGSYASANDPRVLAGLGRFATVTRVRIVWPDGRSEEWYDVPVDRYTMLEQGTGR
jgi:hypothetical protein